MTVIGVRFKDVGKVYYFDPDGMEIESGVPVIVETVRGVEFGYTTFGNRDVPEDQIVLPLKKVIRAATQDDVRQEETNRLREPEAFEICLEKIPEYCPEMNLIEVEFTFDLNKIIFYYTADGRVDFRELVKVLNAIFHTRIEMRQIGPRDETKIMSGMGKCGRELCCATFLDEFQPVSIKMAKEQSTSLNPSKISGICGKLMCCLKYEEETYKFLNENCPAVGDIVRVPDGDGEVLSVNVLRQIAKVAVKKKKQDEITTGYYATNEIEILEKFTEKEEAPAADSAAE
ncbi:MAG: stage 0 sporulation family protein [Defluviitaleaceae bacterium]|nr:stage 0 sporulation family protein [Defluviitaleaceae bacterium]